MYMGGMGVWFENFALPAVINECLMQSYDGQIRLFPNWDKASDASFRTLRARGAFLVSASLRDGEVQPVEVYSERGGMPRASGRPCARERERGGGNNFQDRIRQDVHTPSLGREVDV